MPVALHLGKDERRRSLGHEQSAYNALMQLNHLHLHVEDVERSRAFYERFFGLREHVRHGKILFMTDDARFDLALAPSPHVEDLPAWFHFRFRLSTGEDVRRLFELMQAGGARIIQALEEADDFVFFRCADPDGYLIEVYWE